MIIDDHPEVTVVEDPQSNLNDDGFTEVVSKKQQKRLQDEERRKKEEQIVQVSFTFWFSFASYMCWQMVGVPISLSTFRNSWLFFPVWGQIL